MGNSESTAEMHRVFNTAADVYDQSGVDFFGPIGRRLVEFSGIRAGDSVLDVGCGRGAVLWPAAAAVGGTGEVIGIDLAEEMVKYADADARSQGLTHVTTQVMNGQVPDFPAGRFDAVLGGFSVFIWTHGGAELRPYRTILRPGGLFAASAPSFFPTATGKWGFLPEDVHDLLLPHLTQPKEGDAYDCPFTNIHNNWLVTPEAVTATLTDAGFTDVAVLEEDLPIVVESGAQWVDWTRSHGMRRLWDRLSEQEANELSAEVARRLDALRSADGTITLPTPIVYLRGRAPQA
ncbi:class I SAM-dependent methyltransferase [Streptomyces sp. NBC_01408]|uniref:class I SAM-dependent methyltransferase n=1 Tax=Streptomyces sp. NBC_01408 TaxID=2903855 RepID=UPI0022540CB8|nr:class I SAM-dependent methyltransferase [Streptomyces sp. NBC_01408]MCX4696074.1 class I SAM-dependent methyltransferase [Streptomyces sp. NBC_01408]